jgi:hypothetical protein
MDPRELDRDEIDGHRVYTDYDDVWLPSVSTVLKERPIPPALQNYLQRTSDEEKKKKKFYTQNRGTLIHYELLSQLVDTEYWSDDEAHSEDCLKGRRVHEETGLTGDYETWQRFTRDREWSLAVWEQIRRIYNIHPENVLDVELYVMNTDVGYAGQFDLLYADGTDVVLADIKTSKRVYEKHLLQAASYAKAVDIAVDRLEVIKVNPDSERWVISQESDWKRSRDDLFSEFCELRDSFEENKIETAREEMTSDSYEQ